MLLCNETVKNMFLSVLFKRFQVPVPVVWKSFIFSSTAHSDNSNHCLHMTCVALDDAELDSDCTANVCTKILDFRGFDSNKL